MLLILNVVYRGKISAQVAKDLHRSKSWTSDWLKRYDKKEGIEEIKTRQKSERPSWRYQKRSYIRLRKN